MHRIKYSNQAKIDLNDAISYIAGESVANAMEYLSNYEEKIKLLRSNPYMGIACKTKLIDRDCRVLIYESHIVIYRINSKKKEIFIIRMYHGSIDYINKFNQE